MIDFKNSSCMAKDECDIDCKRKVNYLKHEWFYGWIGLDHAKPSDPDCPYYMKNIKVTMNSLFGGKNEL